MGRVCSRDSGDDGRVGNRNKRGIFRIGEYVLRLLFLVFLLLLNDKTFGDDTPDSPSFWVGHSKDELIGAWREPDKVEAFADQTTRLTYFQSRIESRNVELSYNGKSWRNSEESTPEILIIIVNESGIIIDFEWDQPENPKEINWFAIGHTAVTVGLIALFIYVMHFMPSTTLGMS